MQASPGALANTTIQDLLAAYASLADEGCVSDGPQDYEDGYHTGQYVFWTNCGPEGASFLVLAATADSGNYMVAVTAQAVTEADLGAIDRVLGSFIADFS